ncbi:hypothetical protein D3C78_1028940 [compost metagenome]
MADFRQVVQWHALHAGFHPVPGRVGRGHCCLGMGGVHHLFVHPHLMVCTADERGKPVVVNAVAGVVAHGEVTDST